jgi:hypothetical protein
MAMASILNGNGLNQYAMAFHIIWLCVCGGRTGRLHLPKPSLLKPKKKYTMTMTLQNVGVSNVAFWQQQTHSKAEQSRAYTWQWQ